MDRNLALEFVRVTEAAAISAGRWVGKGDAKKADKAAVDIMRKVFSTLDIKGIVVIGEGEKDQAPMLYIGEEVGSGNGLEVDIAVDPLECTDSVAYGRTNAIAVLAAAPKGTLLHAPDIYMNKIAVGPKAKGTIDITVSVRENLHIIAAKLNKEIKDLTVVVLDRDRHEKLIKDIRDAGARIRLITDGDVAGAIAPSLNGGGIDVLMGIGASAEGVLAACAIKCLGGDMQAQFYFKDKEQRDIVRKMGLKNPDKVLTINDMVKSDKCMFAATGVITGPMLEGVEFTATGARTHSIVMRSPTKTVRFINTIHEFEDEPIY